MVLGGDTCARDMLQSENPSNRATGVPFSYLCPLRTRFEAVHHKMENTVLVACREVVCINHIKSYTDKTLAVTPEKGQEDISGEERSTTLDSLLD